MIGRMDLELAGNCGVCFGRKRNPKKRKEKCPKCHGTGRKTICTSCGEEMPCGGTRTIFDQSYCMIEETKGRLK